MDLPDKKEMIFGLVNNLNARNMTIEHALSIAYEAGYSAAALTVHQPASLAQQFALAIAANPHLTNHILDTDVSWIESCDSLAADVVELAVVMATATEALSRR